MNDLASAIRNVAAGIEAAPQPETGPREWIENPYRDGNSDHQCVMTFDPEDDQSYSATPINHSGNRGANRCTGWGATIAAAVREMEERLDEFRMGVT